MASQRNPLWADAGQEVPSPAPGSLPDSGRAFGVVSTPVELVDFMVGLAKPTGEGPLKVLEPACGESPFLRAFAARYGTGHSLTGVDIDPEAVERSRTLLPGARFVASDYLLWQPEERFDLILGNPPYGIIGDGSHYPIHLLKERKGLYRQRFATWRGKFNIYGAFIEHSVRLLGPQGRLIFVVPATWLVLDDFAVLRRFLAESGRVEVHYWGKAFPGRNVSVVVLFLEKGGKGLALCEGGEAIVRKPDSGGDLIRFETAESQAFEESGVPLGQCFVIHFAARSPEFRRHPLVQRSPGPGLVPVLTGRNLHRGWIDYETCYSELWMPHESAPELRPFYGYPHIVVAHTKGPRVVAALDARCYPWREEFHLVPQARIRDLQAVVDYLNSEPVQRHTLGLYREFVPHLTATMLRRIPIPRTLVSEKAPEQLSLWR